ncbi:MAG: biotin--[acetyl-CoA-carboxylase] ligase [Microbacterium sp.]|nr:biotin--[acetyl-CoA-carboxylase] ligase [Microbacterium sp.]
MLRAEHPDLVRALALPSVGSTNSELKRLALDERWPHRSALVTDDQTAGRGRLDRRWSSPPGDGLAISVLLRGSLPAELLGWVPLVAGLSMRDAVAPEVAGVASLKWPNDVLIDGRKVAGVLAELLSVDPPALVVGVGVNVLMPADRLPVPAAISLVVAGAEAHPGLAQRVYDRYIAELCARYAELESGGAAAASALARTRSAISTVGRRVRVELPGGADLQGVAGLQGVAVGLDEAGRLLVRTDAGAVVPVSAGDVTHVRYE